MTETVFTDLAPDTGLPDALLALNNAFAAQLSPLDPEKGRHLVRHAFMARAIGDEALLIAFDQDAPYDNFNFRWFGQRLARFVYIDRVVVAPARQGRGWARLLYRSLFARALESGQSRIACEINIDPPNPGSVAFHAGLGFEAMGETALTGAGKTVRYYCREIG